MLFHIFLGNPSCYLFPFLLLQILKSIQCTFFKFAQAAFQDYQSCPYLYLAILIKAYFLGLDLSYDNNVLWVMEVSELFSFIFYNSLSNSATFSFNFLITPFEKCALFASSSSTYLWIITYWFSFLIYPCISSSLKISFSVCFDWYSNSLVNWWFWRIVKRVVVSSCYFFKESRLVWISLILLSISSLSLSVAWTFSLSLSATSLTLSAFSNYILSLKSSS